jgi:hypothetical protein
MMVKEAIQDTMNIYALPGQNLTRKDVKFSITDQEFFEMLKLEIRGRSISYSSRKKRKNQEKEKILQQEIDLLQCKLEEDIDVLNTEITLEKKKLELNKIRENKIRAIMLRSKVQWYEMGEKPTIYFCNIEKRNYVSKLITKLNIQGKLIHNFADILVEQKKFYQTLYSLNNPHMADSLIMRNTFLKETNIKF